MEKAMKRHRSLLRSSLLVLLFLGIAAFTILRFIHLSADPPENLTHSGVLYTDEGWYSRNAISRFLGGPWMVGGDFNPIVNMPVIQVVNYAFFKVLGMGLASARLPGAIAFVLTLMLLYLALRRWLSREVLFVSMLLLSCNIITFAFSRVAIAENLLVLFVTASLYFSLASSEQKPGLNAVLASFFLALGVLTKMIGVFFFPVMLFLFWSVEEATGAKLRKTLLKKYGLAVLVLVLVFGLYFLIVILPHMADFRYFNNLNITRRIRPFGSETAFMKGVFVVKGSSLRQLGLSLVIYIGGMMSIIFVFASERLRRDPILLAMVLWVFLYIGIVAFNGYAPPRYYLPVMIPLTILFVNFVFWMPHAVEGKRLPALLTVFGSLLLVASFATNTYRVVRYIGAPRYSFLAMTRGIGEAVKKDGGPDASLIGHFANSISLEAHLRSYNDTYKTWDIHSLMTRYRPGYYVCYGQVEKVNPLDEYYESARYFSSNYRLVFLDRFRALGNYYRGEPVYLYRIEPKEGEPSQSAFNKPKSGTSKTKPAAPSPQGKIHWSSTRDTGPGT